MLLLAIDARATLPPVSEPASPTLLDVLRRRFPDSSARTLRQMLESDRVLVNGVPERIARRPVAESDRVEVVSRGERPLDPRLRLLHSDAAVVVVDKAAGLLTVPSEGGREASAETILDAWAGGTPGRPRIFHVHRIDFDTSGVLVFARTTAARDRLQRRFAAHDIERVYVALVHGAPDPPRGTLRSFLAEDRDLRVRQVPATAPGAREAVTHYATLAAGARFARLELALESGRRHQIRVQLAAAGHPVVGDPMYGGGAADPLGRLALHATRLGFVHPTTGVAMTFESPPPRSFLDLAL